MKHEAQCFIASNTEKRVENKTHTGVSSKELRGIWYFKGTLLWVFHNLKKKILGKKKQGTFQGISKNMLLSCLEVENASLQIIYFVLWNIFRISPHGQRIFCILLCNVISILLLIHRSYFFVHFISQLLLPWRRHVLCFRHSVIKSTGSLKFLLTLNS